MKQIRSLFVVICLLLAASSTFAQKKNFSYKFYGQVRTDLFYNSRANKETVDGLFYMYPLNEDLDAKGKDLNASPNGSFYVLYSRLGLDLTGPQIGKVKSSGKIEADFRGSGTSFSTVRLRQAYLNLDFGTSALLLGQTWHPLFGDVSPKILNLATGAPFQPFSRAPQIRYRYTNNFIQVTGAAIWQSQYLSVGPGNKKSQEYIKKSCIPEFFVGVNYLSKNWLAGVGAHFMSLRPRTVASIENTTTGDDDLYKVNERINSFSYEAHFKYTNTNLYVAGKTVVGQNLTQTSMIGGYGVKKTDSKAINKKYSPLTTSSSWLNVVYGKKWKPGIFLGYVKNLGSKDVLTGEYFGTGTDIDQVTSAGAELTYNLQHWKFGAEYTCTTAWYGTNTAKGRVINTRAITNHRLVVSALFMF